MIDIHSHIIYDIDDGSKTLEESIEILKKMSEYGVRDIILTPHYILNSYSMQNTIKEKEDKLKILKKEIKKNNIEINLYLGNEIYIDKDISDYINIEALPLNKSKYILLEFPMSGEFNNKYGIIMGLIEKGYKVVLAHPERYSTVKKDIHVLDEFKEIGVLFQMNVGSLFDEYGKDTRKTVIKLLKNNYINLIGSDVHSKNFDFDSIKNIEKKLNKYISKEYINDILYNNAKKIID